MQTEYIDCKPSFSFRFLWNNLKDFILIKVILGLFLGLGMTLVDFVNGCKENYLLTNVLGCVIGCIMLWTGSSSIAGYIDHKLDWENEGLKKSIYLIFLNILFIVLIVGLEMYLVGVFKGEPVPFNITINTFIVSIFTTTIINLIFIARSIFNYWKHTKYENEKLKQENLRSQLESLKNQVNPHFLFNSLNTLISIIDDDPETAKNYTQNLSQVYRYILQAKEKDLVTLKEELDFTEAYDYLLKIRYGNNLHFHLEIPDKYLLRMTPTLVLQMLVENAIKHNVISESKPLTIRIFIDENENLVVANNYQPKKLNVESDKVGLKNIADRFRILEDKEIEIIQNEVDFIVKLPLIN